jgi:outer membrane protein assembly factor BamB
MKTPDTWKKTVKRRPSEVDEWTHFLHDASNNAVSDDSVVGPPHQLQWVAGPRWARSHDHLASLSAAVSSGGRIFYIVDEAPIAAVVLEPKWYLVARDALSGVFLWKRPISPWQWHLRGFRSGPSDLARRLVAVGDRLYVTLGIDAPLSVLRATTGQTIATYEGTDDTLEVVYSEGKLFVVAGDAGQAAAEARRRGAQPGFTAVRSQRPGYAEPPPLKRVMAIDAATRQLLWKKSDADTAELMPTTLAVDGGRAFFQNADEIICLDAQSGSEIWRAERTISRSRPTWSAPTLVVYDDVVLSADRAVAQRKTQDGDDQRKVRWIVSSTGGQAPVGELIAFSATDGKRLWSTRCRECYNAPVDVLVADGLVWTGDIVRASDPGATEGRDPKTGQVKRSRPKDRTFFQAGMGHQRCYRNKATNRYLVFGRSGVEFIDVATGEAIPNHWTRGACQYGVIPCNGLLYVPPHTCACFMRSKLNGFNCLAPKPRSQPSEPPQENRLERGPAHTQIPNPQSPIPNPDDWPTYRGDPIRSGRTDSPVPARLRRSWEADLGGRLSSVVIAEGKLLVAQIDAHTVHALSVDDGRSVWSYTAGGRVDSPPTVFQGRVLFGSADGWVYCLRASDGRLAWRFRAAPRDRRIVAYGQLESAWPVPGSVLVRDGVVYCTAGRSSYLDGAIRLLRLDAISGRKLSETIVDHRDPKTGYQRKDVVKGTNMPGALPDVLSCDEASVYMRHTRFDLQGRPQPPEVPHLFSATGFLDDSWWHRTYWMIGTLMGTNYGGWPRVGNQVPAGRLLVFDDSSIYGFGRNQYIHHGAHVGIDGATIFHFRPDRDGQRRMTHYRAFAISRKPADGRQRQAKAAPKKQKQRRQPAVPAKQYRWTQQLPILAHAMLLAPDRLFLAGPPDIFKTDDPAGALGGTRGGALFVVSTEDGNSLAEYRLEDPPVLDGMAAAGGRLYLATTAGEVLCFSEDR